uniref:Uncharacterized protein n=1 Tax=Amphimedon queenslandica TaxID=400682 RepID=A0A1X7VUF0_AMPQE
TFQDNACKREILGLSVYCDHKDLGCDWTGELRHLEVSSEYCPFCFVIAYKHHYYYQCIHKDPSFRSQ